MMQTEFFGGREFGKLNGWRYSYWHERIESLDDNSITLSLVSFARLIAISQTVGGTFLIPTDALRSQSGKGDCPAVDAAINDIMENWESTDIFETGCVFLGRFNNLGLKSQDAIEKN